MEGKERERKIEERERERKAKSEGSQEGKNGGRDEERRMKNRISAIVDHSARGVAARTRRRGEENVKGEEEEGEEKVRESGSP